jgi:ribosomal protein L1
LDHVKTMRPATTKGNFVLGAHLAATMSPGVELAVG